MNRLIKVNDKFPFEWVNLEYYKDSDAFRKEIYLKTNETEDIIGDLIIMFFNLFGDIKHELSIYNFLWWDYCIDTWNIQLDSYDYSLENKSIETQKYMRMLLDSKIEVNYGSSCKCTDWEYFLNVTLSCLISHQAPYSPLIFSVKYNVFFYFHYTGSIGLYYKNVNSRIEYIFNIAKNEYTIID
jgi:hypothetical protein